MGGLFAGSGAAGSAGAGAGAAGNALAANASGLTSTGGAMVTPAASAGAGNALAANASGLTSGNSAMITPNMDTPGMATAPTSSSSSGKGFLQSDIGKQLQGRLNGSNCVMARHSLSEGVGCCFSESVLLRHGQEVLCGKTGRLYFISLNLGKTARKITQAW